MVPQVTGKKVAAGRAAPSRPHEQRRIINNKLEDLSTPAAAGALVCSDSRPPPYTARAPPATSLKLLSYPQLKLRGIPYSRSHLRRLEAAGQFPRRVTLGEGVRPLIGWVEHEIENWIADKMARRTPATETEGGVRHGSEKGWARQPQPRCRGRE
jgi:prophage regulatory protein